MNQETAPAHDLVMEVRDDMGHLEATFTGVSAALDSLPRDRWPLFLAKLSLLLADKVGDTAVVSDCVALALARMDR